jgi:hypothetical protein
MPAPRQCNSAPNSNGHQLRLDAKSHQRPGWCAPDQYRFRRDSSAFSVEKVFKCPCVQSAYFPGLLVDDATDCSVFAPSVQICVRHHTIHVCGTDLTLLGLIWPQSNYSKGPLFQHLFHSFALFWPPPALLELHFARHPIHLVVVASWISSK